VKLLSAKIEYPIFEGWKRISWRFYPTNCKKKKSSL